MEKKKHLHPPRAHALPHVQTLLLGTGQLSGLIFSWEEDDFYFSNEVQQLEDEYSRFCDYYTVTHLHVLLFSTEQKLLVMLFQGPLHVKSGDEVLVFLKSKAKY